jgi:hypothetical protein
LGTLLEWDVLAECLSYAHQRNGVAVCPAGVLPPRIMLGLSRFVSAWPRACKAFLFQNKQYSQNNNMGKKQ